jgi:hypothetical protein
VSETCSTTALIISIFWVCQHKRSTASTPGAPSLSLLSFKSTEQAEILAPRPVSPPPKAFDYRFQTPRRPDVSRRRSLAPATAAALRVGEALNHDDGMIVPIPISDTPMIKRNQEMRRENERRRSSMTLRGNRMSESLGKGDISGWKRYLLVLAVYMILTKW